MSDPIPAGGDNNKKFAGYVERLENLDKERQKLHMDYMTECARINEDKSEILTEAKSNGVPKKALKAVIKTRELQAKLEGLRDDLEADEQDSYDAIRHAIGDLADLPLGKAALQRAEHGGEAVDSLTTLN